MQNQPNRNFNNKGNFGPGNKMGGGNFDNYGNKRGPFQGQGSQGNNMGNMGNQGSYGQHQGGFGKNFGNNTNPNNNPNFKGTNPGTFPKGDEFQNQFCRDFHFGQQCKFP